MNPIAHDWLPWAVIIIGLLAGGLLLFQNRMTLFVLLQDKEETVRMAMEVLTRENTRLTAELQQATPFWPPTGMEQPPMPRMPVADTYTNPAEDPFSEEDEANRI